MEIAVLWFLSMMAMDKEIQSKQVQINDLMAHTVVQNVMIDDISETLEDHEATLLKTAGGLSSLYANHQHYLEKIDGRLEVLENMSKQP
jgi:hypothetical protein